MPFHAVYESGVLFSLSCFHSDRQRNAEHMLGMKLVSTLLYRLHNSNLLRVTIKAICNVLSALLGSKPGQEDIRRWVESGV